MNCIIPFESKVKFDSPVKEICSISLEHEITKNPDEILGNFFVSGTYKEHELSVNTSDFKFTIPFSVELTSRIEEDSIEFSIDNFTYDIHDDEMTVMIDYIVSADDVREDIITEEILEDPIDMIAPEVSNLQDNITIEEQEDEPKVILEEETERKEIVPEIVTGVETENDYLTYHIHVVKESETMESIAMTYKLTTQDIEKLNNITEINLNDKLIIPIINE